MEKKLALREMAEAINKKTGSRMFSEEMGKSCLEFYYKKIILSLNALLFHARTLHLVLFYILKEFHFSFLEISFRLYYISIKVYYQIFLWIIIMAL